MSQALLQNLTQAAYLVATGLFVLSLHWMNTPATARRGVFAGVAAMTSILPELHEFRVPIGVTAIVILTLGNLRGIRESGTIFMVPTYLYIVVMLGIIGWGLFQAATGTLAPYTRNQDGWRPPSREPRR